ncbi:HK97 gp10 family phage protein [Paenimyroides baculatum]|uniref:Uncharacterized protein n=1 Tax=Paenimyroides baculatum TaxID=2608000 RepID=A0A5M6CH05_9FLAO|nr:HK97 gp10 family phage protein [Paenimyroides baculatum]KAA5534307.1 hypothetical protein F0460_09370 [Paenimyroides baculatum]
MKTSLWKASKNFEKELRKNAKPSKDTGTLDRSFKNKGYSIDDNGDKITISCEVEYYAKYVDGGKNNQRAKDFITKSIENIAPSVTGDIISHQFEELEKLFYTDTNISSYSSRQKKYI